MSTSQVELSSGVKEALAPNLRNLGHFHKGTYVISRLCFDSIKTIIRVLRRDTNHEIRRYLGQAKVVQNDLIHIINNCPDDDERLFDATIRLLNILTTSVSILYNEEIPTDKIGRSIYLNLIELLQDYKEAFHNVTFWSKICGVLTNLFEIDYTERSEDQCLKLERLLILLRNVLHIPPNIERERIAQDDISLHEKILWDLRQSQILEFLLYVTSCKAEQRYYIHFLEIFSLILREQNPKLLALSEVQRSEYEKEKDMKDLLALREREKAQKKDYRNMRTFDSTLIMKGMKSFSGKDVIHHGTLDDVAKSLKEERPRRLRGVKKPVVSETVERRSAFSVRLFLKEFCIEFLNCSYNNLMSVVKEKVLSGNALPNDEMYYFWALQFFLEFNCAHNLDIKLVSDSINVQTFHFLQTMMDENFEKLLTDKKKNALWVRKLHVILKAYHSLLQTLRWMDLSKDELIRKMSHVLKSQVFYVPEYRDMALSYLTKFDPNLYSIDYLRDVIETNHLALKLLEEYAKKNKIVVKKKIKRKQSRKRKKKKKGKSVKEQEEPIYESNEEVWTRIRDDVKQVLSEETDFPEIVPFDVTSELSDDEHKAEAMKKIQRLLHEGNIVDAIGLLKSSREVWPENDEFGMSGMDSEYEMKNLEEICLAELGNEKIPVNAPVSEEEEELIGSEDEEEDDEDDLENYTVSEENFDIMSYKKQLVNKKVVEACSVLLKNYSKNTDYTNHCIIKVLWRIGWECGMPAMMYQLSLFWTLLNVLNDKYKNQKEINDFAINLLKKFRENARKNKAIFVDLLFWKTPTIALQIQDQDDSADELPKHQTEHDDEENNEDDDKELERFLEQCRKKSSSMKKAEWIKNNLAEEVKALEEIEKGLKEMGLLNANVRTARYNFEMDWLKEEDDEIEKLYGEFRESDDVVARILDKLTLKPSRKSVRQRLLHLELVTSLDNDGSDDERSSEIKEPDADTIEELKFSLQDVKSRMKEKIRGDNDGPGMYSLLAFVDAQIEALEGEDFNPLTEELSLVVPLTKKKDTEKKSDKKKPKPRKSAIDKPKPQKSAIRKPRQKKSDTEKTKTPKRDTTKSKTQKRKKPLRVVSSDEEELPVSENKELPRAGEEKELPETSAAEADAPNEEPEEPGSSKKRQRRFLSSDSDSNDENSVDLPVVKGKKRMALIDSDSDS